MATPSVTYTFTNNSTADGTHVSANFADLVDFLDDDVVHVDASRAMTSILALPASDPTTANQATRKAYVDAMVGKPVSTWTPTIAQGASTNISKTVVTASYLVLAEAFVIYNLRVNLTGSGTAGSAITFTLPVACANTSQHLGSGTFGDTSATTGYNGQVIPNGSTSIAGIMWMNTSNVLSFYGITPSLAVASGDTMAATGVYLKA